MQSGVATSCMAGMDFFRKLVALITKNRARLADAVIQELRQRYAGSVLGLAWAVLYPLLLLGFYTTVYAFIFRVRPATMNEMSYVVLVLSGLVPLLAFIESMNASAGSLSANRHILLNTVFPAELIPLRTVIATQMPSLSGLAMTLLAATAMGRTSFASLLVIPVLWLLLVMFVAGIAWILSLVTLVLRDIQQALGIVGMTLMVLSPAAYTPEMVPHALKAVIYLNPLSYFVLSFQSVICYGKFPEIWHLAMVAILGIGTYVGGFFFFQRAKFVFFDHA